MQLNDFLDVLRAEFEQAADDVDAALAGWMDGGVAQAPQHADALTTTLDRLAEVARMVGLEGHAAALEALSAAARQAAVGDEAAMAAGLGWAMGWREPFTGVFAHPGEAAHADALIDYLGFGPQGLDDEHQARLRAHFSRPPELPSDDIGPDTQAFDTPGPEDVSLDVPAEVDEELLDALLEGAPDQVDALRTAAAALLHATPLDGQLAEAQRVAHTLKGSGNIIGIRGVGRLAHRIEDLLDFAATRAGVLPVPMAQTLVAATDVLAQMVQALRGEDAAPSGALPALQALNAWSRAIADGSWPEQVLQAERQAPADSGPVEHPARHPGPAPAAVAPADAPDAPPQATPPGATLRVESTRVEALTRRAGQHLVRQGRLARGLHQLDQHLASLLATQAALDARLAQLQAQIDRQGVSLHSRTPDSGIAFDPLEMDRYSELHSLARLAAEMVADGLAHGQAARDQARDLAQAIAEQSASLKDQHTDLLGTRLVPFRQLSARLQRNVAQTAAATGKPVQLHIDCGQARLDLGVLDRLTEPLLHLLRNAVDHGIEPASDRELLGKPPVGSITLRARRAGPLLHIECRDDGAGLDLPAIHAKAVAAGLIAADAQLPPESLARLVLLPGFSTRDTVTDISGRGLGLDVVAERVRAMRGTLDISTETFEGSCFTLTVPATTGTAHALVVEVGGQAFALPTSSVVEALPSQPSHTPAPADAREAASDPPAAAQPLEALLGLDPGPDDGTPGARPSVVTRVGRQTLTLGVDRVVEARELVLQDLGPLLGSLRGVAGGALQADGRVLLLLDPTALGEAARPGVAASAARQLRQRSQAPQRRALVVDDAHSVRKVLVRHLADNGWQVLEARDGFEALAELARERVDLVITDLEMPQLNGLELTRQIRAQPALEGLPVLMITSRDTAKHRHNAQQAGVDRYLTKPVTDEQLQASIREALQTRAQVPGDGAPGQAQATPQRGQPATA